MEILYSEESYKIVGACFELYNEKGCDFLQPLCHECLSLELGMSGIPFRSKAELRLEYNGQILRQSYEPDFICNDRVILEIKAVSQPADQHRAQVHNYLKVSGFRSGSLVNFGRPSKLQSE
jgi:GxxExxY protein